MKIKVLFFANFREVLDCQGLNIELDDNSNLSDLCQLLSNKGDRWHSIFDSPSKTVKIALNQEMTDLTSDLSENDEVAFFPPVTGG